MDATALAALIRRGEIDAAAVLDAALARIAERNPALNAVVHDMGEAAQAAVAGGLPDGPFTGIPFLVKDLYAFCAGAPCENGSRLYRGFVPQQDAEIVRRLRAAGVVIAGRTATSEFGLSVSTETVAFGITRNPWQRDHSAGGSSGGSAAAVAARMVPMAHASDGGGSIRIPAACCGLFGLKPTRARVPLGPGVAEAWAGLATQHAVTRSVRDSAALLDVVAGGMLGDPAIAPVPARPFGDEVGADPGRLRIGFSRRGPGGDAVADECAAAVDMAAALAVDFGHGVEEADPDIDLEEIKAMVIPVIAANMAHDLPSRHPMTGAVTTPEDVEPLTWAMAEHGRGISAVDYVAAVHGLHRIGRAFAVFFERYDVWLSPALASPPPRHGYFATDTTDIWNFSDRVLAFTPFTAIANISGQPAATIPLHWPDSGLPAGIQITARFGDEATLFALAAQYEAARPWQGRLPLG
ncbi:MAG: amidase [Alphaproteobacteria bacterium]|nr:amidase [Alphaproteobacteria bacterium]